MSTGLIEHVQFLDHDTGSGHPERPDRLRAIGQHLRMDGLDDALVRLPFEPAPLEKLQAVHDPAYVQRVFEACERGQRYIDTPDSAVCPRSAAVAQLAAGGVLAAVDAVMAGDVRNVFCATRPPGHHAEADRSMGFCLFNHAAIAAAHLLDAHGLERVAVVDFDVHHGNGTQHIFEDRADVLYISLHQDPATLYPGTGRAAEAGIGAGDGFTLNLPLPPGTGDEAYARAITERVLPALDEYRPRFVLLSAGFDACAADPLANLALTPGFFGWITGELRDAAGRLCNGQLVSVLEGGYDLDALGRAAAAHVRALLQ